MPCRTGSCRPRQRTPVRSPRQEPKAARRRADGTAWQAGCTSREAAAHLEQKSRREGDDGERRAGAAERRHGDVERAR
eukprot:7173753-Prymnesium_polylepis.1